MKLRFYIIITILFFFASCAKPEKRPCWKSNGKIISITNEWSQAHHTLEIKEDINLILINDSLNYLTIEGPENLIEFIDISSSNEKITISNNNRCDFLREPQPINVYYHYKVLRNIELLGYGTLSNHNTIQHNININAFESLSNIELKLMNDTTIFTLMKGAVGVSLNGSSNYLYGYSSGYGPFKADSLICNTAHGHSTGLGDFYLNATESLIIELRSMGDFYYFGNPIITNFIQTGTGKIINMN